MTILLTQRISFRNWKNEDLKDALRLWGDPEVMAFLNSTGGFTDEQVLQRLADEIARGQKFGVQYWRIEDRNDGSFIGCCGLRPFVFPGGKYSETDLEVGFHLLPSKWSKGYAYEAAQGAIKYAFEEMKLPKVLAGHHPDNVASKRLLSKLNFNFIRTQLYEPTGLQHPVYELLKSNWNQS